MCSSKWRKWSSQEFDKIVALAWRRDVALLPQSRRVANQPFIGDTDDGEMLGWCSVRVHCHLLRSTAHVQGQSNVDQCLCLEFPFCVLSDNDVDTESKPHVSSLRSLAVTGMWWSTKVGTQPGALADVIVGPISRHGTV